MTESKDLMKEYEYYDDADIEDLHTGDAEPWGQNASAGTFGMIGGGLALVACLVLVGLMGAIYHRDRTSITLSHLVMACLGVLIAGLAAFGCIMAAGAIKKRTEPNHLIIGVALLLALVFFCYFLASAVYIYMYRPFHYAYLIQTKGNQKDWKDTFKNWSFNRAWGEDRRILWWVAFFCLVAAIGFLIAAICLWLLSKFPVQSSKMCLGAACFAGVLLGLFAVDYLRGARKQYGNYALKDMQHNLLTALLILLYVGIGIFFLNAILNIFKKRSGHFVFGAILIIWAFIFVCVLGLILRDMRQKQFSQIAHPEKCASILDSLHQDDIKRPCHDKYISSSCTKAFLRSKWETDGSSAFINPLCCHTVNNWLLWKTYICGALCLLMLTAALVAIAFNFYLSDKSEYLEFEDKKMGLAEIVFAALCVLAVIAFVFWFWFRPSYSVARTNPNNPDVIYSKYTKQVVDYEDDNYIPVDLNKVYNGKIPMGAYVQNENAVKPQQTQVQTGAQAGTQQVSAMHTGDQILTLKLDKQHCDTQDPQRNKCGVRVAVLVMNGKMNQAKDSITGSPASRQVFYSQDTNIKNDYKLVYGNVDDVNAYMKSFQVTPYDLLKPTKVLFKAEQLDLKDLNNLGLKSNEKTSSFTLTTNGQEYDDNGFHNVATHQNAKECYYTNSCVSGRTCFNSGQTMCEQGFHFYSSDGTTKVTIPLKVLDVNGKRVDYNETGNLASNSFYDYNHQRVYINPVNLNKNLLELNVPKPVRSDVGLNINISDKSGHYLPVSEYIVIPVRSSSTYVSDDILLLTKDGKGCVGSTDVDQCFASKSLHYTSVDVYVVDEQTGKPVSGESIKLSAGQTGAKFIGQATTNNEGYASFSNVAYDYYTVSYQGSDYYLPASQQIQVQADIAQDAVLTLHQKSSTQAVIEENIYNLNNTNDRDLMMNIRSYNGTECVVSPQNKWCAYAEHVNDIEVNKSGFERIRLNRFTVSHYLTYLQDSAQYSGTCGANDVSQYGYYKSGGTTQRSLKFNFKNIRKLQNTNYSTLYCFTGWGLNSRKDYRTSGSGAVSAKVCESMYPSSSQYNVDKLKQANSAQQFYY